MRTFWTRVLNQLANSQFPMVREWRPHIPATICDVLNIRQEKKQLAKRLASAVAAERRYRTRLRLHLPNQWICTVNTTAIDLSLPSAWFDESNASDSRLLARPQTTGGRKRTSVCQLVAGKQSP